MEFCLENCTTCKCEMKQIYELTNGNVQYESTEIEVTFIASVIYELMLTSTTQYWVMF